MQLDAAVGTIMQTLERLKLTENTMILLSSDNGPILDDGYKDQAHELNGKHRPTGPLRGNKYSSYEAGTRVPFIISWPARVKPGVSNALFCQIDLLASLAALTGQQVDLRTSADSQNHLPALLGEASVARTALVEQGGLLALRDRAWKFIPPSKGPRVNANTNSETGNAPEPQLYNLENDLGETNNLASTQTELVNQMAAQLEAIQKAQANQ
jgi:arylsulfatase A-like enzyme